MTTATISQRATGSAPPAAQEQPLVGEVPKHERPLSEQFRIVARAFVEADAAARLMEELKTTTLEQKKKELLIKRGGDIPDSHLERDVKATDEWHDYIVDMVKHRTEANMRKVQMEYIRMKFSEAQSAEASARHEARLSR